MGYVELPRTHHVCDLIHAMGKDMGKHWFYRISFGDVKADSCFNGDLHFKAFHEMSLRSKSGRMTSLNMKHKRVKISSLWASSLGKADD